MERLDEKIRVVVLGEVARPGVYEVRPGISLGEVVRNAGVLPGSDLRKLYGKKIVISSCSVRVEKKDVLRKVKKRATKKEKMG